ncbi:DEAD/DEAH box helicase family protein [Agriterribacter sp.]|uniref:DEAD/DEAH box helicase family protein n=1 Tax=Agriterribacter sp. TaxID=2821509 RepID=UPI002BB06518|nr:DEAD/DEAH box helicase family protein [Agriterribacter sp.]HRO46292.1 DEAD/DEAH box helicase family protein [Agriterribacter sp.]HRQ18533.1 DEAD/DEAH box helicase family protein [Agriterribacter sp.]
MELKEIREVVAEILSDINKNQSNLTYRRYDTFFDRIGMTYRRKFDILAKFDRQFKNKNITFWAGKEQVKRLEDFHKGETITFRLTENINNTNHQPKTKTINYQYAGKINIANAESGIVPYEHQEKAFYNLQEKIIKTNKNPFAGLLVLPTGGGKTITAAHWICRNYLDKGKKVLWLAHRHELLEQAKSTFADKLAYNDIFEQRSYFNYRIISGIHDKPINIQQTDDLIISSKDSIKAGFNHLYNNWIKNNTEEIFLVIDEAHHATAKTYRQVIESIKNSVSHFQLLGLTATPFRTADKEQGLLKKVFPDDIVYKIDLRTLIRLGILSEPHFEEVSTGLNFIKELSDEQIIQLNYFDIDSIGSGIAKTIAENDDRNHTIVNRYIRNKEKYKQTIVFALNVDNAIALNAMFKEQGVKSDFVISTVKDQATGVTISSKDNKDKIAKFRNGEIEVLINVNILTEGTDVPNVQSIFLARPTISSILMTQMIGRGLRGPKAGGTKEAFIVSFIDEWQNKVAWVNPEKLYIEDNINFKDVDRETKKQILRLVAINKIEEFAILTNKIIDPEKREELEKLSFIERFPVGIYQFRYLEQIDDEEIDKNCEVLVYDNILQSYKDFINALPSLFIQHKLTERDYLHDDELEELAEIIEDEFFKGTLKYPAYLVQDLKNILQYYTIKDELPPYVELKDREKYDIDKIAVEIREKDLGEKSQTELLNKIWEDNETAWETFFNFDKRNFLREIQLAKTRLSHPELFVRRDIKPKEEKELRSYEKLSFSQLREQDPVYEKQLRDSVFAKFTDESGFYYCANSGYKSKNKLDFQIDHIKPMHNGGLTVFENLQLLTRSENAKKGNNE